MKKIILASQSPRRRELLKEICHGVDSLSPDYDEKIDTDVFSEKIIENIALNKALSLAKSVPEDSLILSADTVVVLDGKILGKPEDKDDALRMLKDLSGKTHRVVTSVSIFDVKTQKHTTRSTTSFVTFSDLTEEQIKNYIETKNPLDKAGSYGIQELEEGFVTEVKGSFTNIVGLPLETVKEMLEPFLTAENGLEQGI